MHTMAMDRSAAPTVPSKGDTSLIFVLHQRHSLPSLHEPVGLKDYKKNQISGLEGRGDLITTQGIS